MIPRHKGRQIGRIVSVGNEGARSRRPLDPCDSGGSQGEAGSSPPNGASPLGRGEEGSRELQMRVFWVGFQNEINQTQQNSTQEHQKCEEKHQ